MNFKKNIPNQINLLKSCYLSSGCLLLLSSTYALADDSVETMIETNGVNAEMIHLTSIGSDYRVTPSLLFMDETQGTLDLPLVNNAIDGVNQTDGWPVSMPISVYFKGQGIANGDITSGVHVFKLSAPLSELEHKNIIQKRLKLGIDYSAFYDGESIRIQFTESLTPSSNYIYAVTSEVCNVNTKCIAASQVDKVNQSIALNGLLAILEQTPIIEKIVTSELEDNRTIIMASAFTTASVGNVIDAVKRLTEFSYANNRSLNEVYQSESLDLSTAYTMKFSETEDFLTALTNDNNIKLNPYNQYKDMKSTIKQWYQDSGAKVNVTRGTVKLPYYLQKGDDWDTQPMTSAMPSTLKIQQALLDPSESENIREQLRSGTFKNDPVDTSALMTSFSEQMKLVGSSLYLNNGQQLDPERLLTRYSPIPQITEVNDVPFILITPKDGQVKDIVIFQHGASNVKENIFNNMYEVANAGLAVIAIDTLHHGERALSPAHSGNTDIFNYINLSSFPVLRDNFRQTYLDIIGLRASLTISAQAGLLNDTPLENFDPKRGSNVKMLGFSLGGIISFGAIARANDSLDSDFSKQLYQFSSLSIRSSAGHLSGIVLGSDFYRSPTKHHIAYQLFSFYRDYSDSHCKIKALSHKAKDAERISAYGQCYTDFEKQASSKIIETVSKGISAFAYAMQNTVDSVDPFNNVSDFIADDGALSTPVFVTEVRNDYALPNSVSWSPFTGTEPISRKLGLQFVNKANSRIDTPEAVLVIFNSKAQHSTFGNPLPDNSDLSHHKEMMRQTTEFLLNDSLSEVKDRTVLN
ncbi:lipase [Vibrio cyclitrophicus]|nr:VolA/Pla-1 family phospholipase [Vibrio cyclitrophicus]UPR34876.1 lipase [Vibrio cyclitrophicus]UPR48361.1 lipase [Vibrio cyclitrophicus]